MKKQRTTIKELATLLDLNIATISRALNDSPLVNEKTKKLVLDAAKNLNYQPNKNAQNLVKGKDRGRFVGILIPNIVHEFFFGVLKGVVAELNRYGYNLMVFNIGEDREGVFERLIDDAPSGLLVFAQPLQSEERRLLHEKRIPFLYVDYMSEMDSCVFIDNERVGRIAGEFLKERGVRRPVFIGTPVDTQQQILRERGFRNVFEEVGISVREKAVAPIDEREVSEVVRQLVGSGLADGIFFFCDEMAFAGVKSIRALGVAVPLIGCDDLPLAEWVGLSTIRQEGVQLGITGARSIIQDIETLAWGAGNGPVTEKRVVSLEPWLVIRST